VVSALPSERICCARQDGGHCKHVLELHRSFIAERINQTPQLSLHRLKDELGRGVKVSHDTVWRFLGARGFGSKTYGPPRLQEGFEGDVRGLLKRIRSCEIVLAAKMDIRACRSL
jgi:hypothetical protein